MKYEIVVGEKELMAARELMGTSKSGRKARRIIFIVLAVLFFILAMLGLYNEKTNPVLTSISFGLTAFFLWLLFLSRPKQNQEMPLKTKRGKVTYDFCDEVLISSTADQNTAVRWNRLKNWGTFKAFLYIEFSGKQFVVIEKKQLSEEALKEIEKFLLEKHKRKDVLNLK